MISLCVKLKEISVAFFIFAKVFRMGYDPDIYNFNTLIRGLCLSGDVVRVVQFYKKLAMTEI